MGEAMSHHPTSKVACRVACKACGSPHLQAQAIVEWVPEALDWKVTSFIHDSAWCLDCRAAQGHEHFDRIKQGTYRSRTHVSEIFKPTNRKEPNP